MEKGHLRVSFFFSLLTRPASMQRPIGRYGLNEHPSG